MKYVSKSDKEMIDVLYAISKVSARLAKNLSLIDQNCEATKGDEKNVGNGTNNKRPKFCRCCH